MLESYLIMHCSATLASLKTGNLFSYPGHADEHFQAELRYWDSLLQPKGLRLRMLRQGQRSVLVYVYRPAQLACDFSQPEVVGYLRQFGYADLHPERALAHLTARLLDYRQFPHEIGLFLGYPLADVMGFIENQGKNCKQIGCWKVYGDESKASRTFAKYQKCHEIYTRMWKRGRSLEQLTVAV